MSRQTAANAIKTILEPAREIKVFKETDVAVVGGGPAGVAAAIAAARNGARTVLLERYGHLGGLATGGLVLVIMPMSDGTNKQQITGIAAEMVDRLDALGGAIHPRTEDLGSADEKLVAYWRNFPFCVIEGKLIMSAPFDPELYKCVLNDLVEEAGVKLLLHCWGTQAIVENNAVKGVIFESKAGRQAILAKVTIDTTGDGDIFASAGAEFDDNITPELRANLAVPWRLGNIDFEKFYSFQRTEPQKFQDVMREFHKVMGMNPNELNYFVLRYSRLDAAWVNNQIPGRNGLNIEDLTWVEVEVRKKMRIFVDFYRKNIPGYENCWIIDTAPQIGVRCTRRLIGEYVLKNSDVRTGVIHPDTVCVFPDHHHVVSAQYPHWFVPYRCLLPRKIDNLLTAGRLISAESWANELLRPIQFCIGMGQAAGTAAALAVKGGVSPKKVNVKNLQRTLLKQNFGLQGVEI